MKKRFILKNHLLLIISFLGLSTLLFPFTPLQDIETTISLQKITEEIIFEYFEFDNTAQDSISDLESNGWSFSEAQGSDWFVGSLGISKSPPNALRAHGTGSASLEGALYAQWGEITNTTVEGWVYLKSSNALQTGLLSRCSTNIPGDLANDTYYATWVYGSSGAGHLVRLVRYNDGDSTILDEYDIGLWPANYWHYLKLEVLTLNDGSVQLKVWYTRNENQLPGTLVITYIDNSVDKILQGYPGVVARVNQGSSYYSIFDNIRLATGSISTSPPPPPPPPEEGGPIIISNPPESVITSTIPINVVFIGFDETMIDMSQIDLELTHWYTPKIYSPDGEAGGEYNLDVNYYLSGSTTLETDFTSYLLSLSSIIPPPADLLDYNFLATSALLIDASSALSWLNNNINSYFGSINNNYCLYLIDTFSKGYISDYYYYEMVNLDPDTGIESVEQLTILYGGENNRGVFLDLSAGPVNYYEDYLTETKEGVSASTITPIWEYSFPQDKTIFNGHLTEYIQETIDLVFTPSYLYPPVVKDSYDIDVYVLDHTFLELVISNPNSYFNPSILQSSLEQLIPYTTWDISYTVDYLSNHPVLLEVLQTAYDNTDHANYPNAIQPYDSVLNYLDNFRAEFYMGVNTIPVFIFVWDDYLFFGFEGALGGAESDGSGYPLMVLCGYDPTLLPDEGYTKLVIHELGHILGLRHPHDGWSWDRYNDIGDGKIVDMLRDFIATPMGYAHQETIFSTFDKDSLNRGHCLSCATDAWSFIHEANVTMIDKGYTNLDSNLEVYLFSAISNYKNCLQIFEDEDFYQAYQYSEAFYDSAKGYRIYALGLPKIPPPSLPIPVDIEYVSFNFDASDQNSVTSLENNGWFFGEANSNNWGVTDSSSCISPPKMLHSYGTGTAPLEGALYTQWGIIADCIVQGWVYQHQANALQTGLIARCSTNLGGDLSDNSYYGVWLYCSSTAGETIRLVRVINGESTILQEHDVGYLTSNMWHYLKLEVKTLSDDSVQLKVWHYRDHESFPGNLIINYNDNSNNRILEGYPGIIGRCNQGSKFYSIFDNIDFGYFKSGKTAKKTSSTTTTTSSRGASGLLLPTLFFSFIVIFSVKKVKQRFSK